MKVEVVVGCPVWDRAWCLDAWFDCVLANTTPSKTGLVFCVPASDQASRDVISRRSEGFAFTEVLRDGRDQYARQERIRDQHQTLANARNRILQVVQGVGPDVFVSWDSDFFVPGGTVPKLRSRRVRDGWRFPVTGVWAWLNRQPPQQTDYKGRPYEYHPPMAATVMDWDSEHTMRARHAAARDWDRYSGHLYVCDIVLAFQVMTPEAYKIGRYGAHPDDENLPFFWSLYQRGIPVACDGAVHGVHLYERDADGPVAWPKLMALKEQRPLEAARWRDDRTREQQALGLFPMEV